MELTNRPYISHTAAPTCTKNDELTVVTTPLPNLEYDLDIDTPSIDKPMYLSIPLFLEECRHSSPNSTRLEESAN